VKRRPQAGLTLIEVMIASAIMVVMMALTWRTVSGTLDSRRTFEKFEAHNHELRMALARMVADFESAYISKNEDQNATNPRTMFIAKSGSRVPEIRFSTMAHRVFVADANESEQTVVSYVPKSDPEKSSVTNWIRREQRRPSNEPPSEVPADYDVLVHDIVSAKLEYWNWKNLEWTETWNTTQSDGQKGWLPSRVRIAITVKDPSGNDYKVTTQARILMQEALNFTQTQ
jgi:prepilin-type N-terminal cleavage/methylation domain-containing protein